MKSVAVLLVLGSSASLAAPTWQRTPTGIVVTPTTGPKAVRLDLYGDRIVRVTESPDGKFDVTPTAAVIAQPASLKFGAAESGARAFDERD